MALNGDLNDMSLIDLIEVFQIGTKSGVLYLSEGTQLGLLYVASGQVVDAVVLTWPARSLCLTSDAAFSAMKVWRQAKFIFHHQIVDRPIRIGVAATQQSEEIPAVAHGASVPQEWEIEPTLPQTQTVPAPQQRERDGVYTPRGTCAPTLVVNDQAQNPIPGSSRWSLDLEPFKQTSKPAVLEASSFYPPPKHRQPRTSYAPAGVARTKLISIVMQRIREL